MILLVEGDVCAAFCLIALLRLNNQLKMSGNKEILIYFIILPSLPITQ